MPRKHPRHRRSRKSKPRTQLTRRRTATAPAVTTVWAIQTLETAAPAQEPIRREPRSRLRLRRERRRARPAILAIPAATERRTPATTTVAPRRTVRQLVRQIPATRAPVAQPPALAPFASSVGT